MRTVQGDWQGDQMSKQSLEKAAEELKKAALTIEQMDREISTLDNYYQFLKSGNARIEIKVYTQFSGNRCVFNNGSKKFEYGKRIDSTGLDNLPDTVKQLVLEEIDKQLTAATLKRKEFFDRYTNFNANAVR